MIGKVGDAIVIRLKSRENNFGGDSIIRECSCVTPGGVSAFVPAELCPVHVLWPWVVDHAAPGERLFPEKISHTSKIWLQVALEARNYANATKFTLHSLRRGAAQALVCKGCSLATLLKAGGWRSSAFHAHMDLMGVENRIFTASADALVDFDEFE